MTSKEALKELRDSFENDVYKVEREMLDIIEDDLEVLELLKKYVIIDKKDNSITISILKNANLISILKF